MNYGKLKVFLILPGNTLITEPRRTWIPPGLLEVVSIMRQAGADVTFYDEITKGHIQRIPDGFDLYCIGGLTPSRNRAYKLATRFKRCGFKILAGGMDVTGIYNEQGKGVLLEHYDSIVAGAFTVALCRQIFDDCRAGCLNEVYKSQTNVVEWNIPAHDLIDPRMFMAPGAYRSSVGCDHNCPFCSVKLICGNTTCCKPISILEREFETLPKSRIYVDASDNVAANYDFFTTELIPFLIRKQIPWLTEVSAKHLLGDASQGRSELFGLLRKSGAKGIYFGVENPFMKMGDKGLSPEAYEEVVRKLHENKILAVGSFIFDMFEGKSAETEEDIERTVNWMIKTKFDIVQISLLSLLPGTDLRTKAIRDGTIIDYNPEHYDGSWPTRMHPNLSPERRIELMAQAYKRFYGVGNILRRRTIGSPFASYYAANFFARRCATRWQQSFDSAFWQRTMWPTELGR